MTFLLLPIENLNSSLFLYINKNAELSFVSFFKKTHEENVRQELAGVLVLALV